MGDAVQFLDRGAVDRLIGKNRKVWLRDEVEGDPEIYGGAADLVRSDAVLRLAISKVAPAGLIAFGTRHPLGDKARALLMARQDVADLRALA